jgi:hypothetical protein
MTQPEKQFNALYEDRRITKADVLDFVTLQVEEKVLEEADVIRYFNKYWPKETDSPDKLPPLFPGIAQQEDEREQERRLLEHVWEELLEFEQLRDFVHDKIKSYNLDFDIDGPLTNVQEEIICQLQVVIYLSFLGKIIGARA